MQNTGDLLIQKIMDGENEKALELLEDIQEIDHQNKSGETALLAAVKTNNLDLVKHLIGLGANPNARDNTMLTPYLCAGASGFYEVLEYLLLNGADKSSINRFGGTALLPSSEKGYMRTVEICLKHNIDVNHKNDLGWSALEETVILGDGGILYSDIVEILVQSGADRDVSDNLGIPVKTHAKNQQKIMEILNNGSMKREYSEIINSAKRLAREDKYIEAFDIISKNKLNLPKEQYAYYMGYYNTMVGEYDKAIEFFMSVQEDYPEFWFYIANCQRLKKDSKNTFIAFDTGISKSENPDFFRYHKTNYLREVGMHEAAIAETEELLRNDPDRYDYFFHMANSQRSLGLHIQAAETIENAIRIDSGNALYYHHKAKSYELAGQLENAIIYYEKAIDRLKRPLYYKELGECYLLLGKNDMAKEAFAHCKKS